MKASHSENVIYQAVLCRELEIDVHGQIWRIKKRTWDRWRMEVRTTACARCRAEKRLPKGYLQVRSMFGNVRYQALAHRLVWRHFRGEIPDGMVVNHRNGLKEDNRPENLEILTPSENAKHAVHVLRVGRCANQRGMANHRAKLSTMEVQDIRARWNAGQTQIGIARAYGVPHQTISGICRGITRGSG